MADEYTLTTGVLPQIRDDTWAGEDPVVQVLSTKPVPGDRHRLIISDGDNYTQAITAAQLNALGQGGDEAQMRKNTVVRLTNYASNVVQEKRIIVIMAVDILGQAEGRIGEPAALETAIVKADDSAAPAAAADAEPAAGRGGSNASMTSAARGASTSNRPAGGASRPGMATNAPIYPIEGLSPYQNKWTIKARVTSKSEIRHWSNQKGDGKLFSVNLLDDTSEIKATGFNDAVDRLYPLFEEGKVYYISKARVQIAKKQFSNLPNEYELAFERDTEVSLAEDQDSVRQVSFDFKEIGNLGELQKDEICDILGVVTESGDLAEITAKATQKQIKKRELEVVDRSGYQVRVTLWGKTAENWQPVDNGVYAFKGAKVGDFGGRTLSMPNSSSIVADPDIEEAHALRGWFDTEGRNMSFQSFASAGMGNGAGGAGGAFKPEEFKPIQMIVDDPDIGMSDKFDYFNSRITVMTVKQEPVSYPACPTDRCNKKVTQEGQDSWRCDKCNATYPAPSYRYVLSFAGSDFSGQAWFSTFNEVGQQLLGITADDLQQIKENDPDAYTAELQKAHGTSWTVAARAKAESYGDQTRVRYNVQRAQKIDYAAAGQALLADIRSYGIV